MRKLIAILLFLAPILSNGQNLTPQGTVNGGTRQRGGFAVDSIIQIPKKDTTSWFGTFGNLTIRPQDGKLYYRSSVTNNWFAVSDASQSAEVFTGTLAQVRSLQFTPPAIILTDYGGGIFVKNDTVTVDNTGTQIINGIGQGYSRIIEDEKTNVKWFGALGDNTSNDTDPTNKTIAYLQQKGSGTIFFPKGRYLIDSLPIRGRARISILGESNGLFLKGASPANDSTVTTLIHTGSGAFVSYGGVDDLSSNSAGFSRIENIMIVGGANTTKVVFIEYSSRGITMENCFIGADQAATACNGLEIKDSWIMSLSNINIRHGSQEGEGGFTSTGVGLKLHNIAADEVGGALNQIVCQNINTRFFHTNMYIGADNTDSAKSQNINGLVFIGGTAEYAKKYNVRIGTGVQGLSFVGTHNENAGVTSPLDVDVYEPNSYGYYIEFSPHNISILNSKLHNNDRGDSSAHIYVRGRNTGDGKILANVNIENNYFSNVNKTGVWVANSGANIRNIFVEKNTFAPTSNGAGVGVLIDTTGNIQNVNVQDNVYGFNSNVLAANVVGGYNSRGDIRFARVAKSKTSNYNVSTTETGGLISNAGASATVTLNLPASSEYLHYAFLVEANRTLNIKAASGQTINYADSQIVSNRIGDYVELLGTNKNTWIVRSNKGTWIKDTAYYTKAQSDARYTSKTYVDSLHALQAVKLTASQVIDFPSIAATSEGTGVTVTVTGALTTDNVIVNVTNTAGVDYKATVTATNTVTIYPLNITVNSIDPASATFKVMVLR